MIRAAFFDAVGTVIHPVRGAPALYAEAARRYGLHVDAADVLPRFVAAYREHEAIDAANGWRTDEAREVGRWKAIVAHALPGAPAGCFADLYGHFATPAAWGCPPDAAPTFERLHALGLTLGLASNYDARLLTVVAGRPELARLVGNVLVSAALGVRKPGAAFFDAVVAAAGCAPGDILFVGDDPDNDYAGATAAGMRAVLLDPHDKSPDVPCRVRSLGEVVALATNPGERRV